MRRFEGFFSGPDKLMSGPMVFSADFGCDSEAALRWLDILTSELCNKSRMHDPSPHATTNSDSTDNAQSVHNRSEPGAIAKQPS
jgi:hypothetical protein